MDPHEIDHNYFTRFRKQLGAMDPNLKLILDEFKVVRGSVSYSQTSLTLQIETVETNIGKRFSYLEN